MSETSSNLSSQSAVRLRDKTIPLIFWIGLLILFFRPLAVHDYRDIANAVDKGALDVVIESPVQENAPATRPVLVKSQAWKNAGSDALCFAILAVTLFLILSGRVGSIAFNTFREAVRNRILYFILFFALILMGASGILKELSIAAHERIVIDLGLTCIEFFGLLVAVFVGISLVYNELERKTIYTIVSKPVHRHQFLLGKFFGLLMTIYVIVAIMTLFFFIVLNYQAMTHSDLIMELATKTHAAGADANWGTVQAKFYVASVAKAIGVGCMNMAGFPSPVLMPDAAPAVSANLLVVVAMTCLTLMIVTAFAVLFSSFTTPTLSAVFTIMIFLAGRLNEDLIRAGVTATSNALSSEGVAHITDLSLLLQLKVRLYQTVALLVPNLDSLSLSSAVIHDEFLTVWRYPVLYSLCYTATILMLAIVIFNRRNFK